MLGKKETSDLKIPAEMMERNNYVTKTRHVEKYRSTEKNIDTPLPRRFG